MTITSYYRTTSDKGYMCYISVYSIVTCQFLGRKVPYMENHLLCLLTFLFNFII